MEKVISCEQVGLEVAAALDSLEAFVWVDTLGDDEGPFHQNTKSISFSSLLSAEIIPDLQYESQNFDDPLFIMFSSSFTGCSGVYCSLSRWNIVATSQGTSVAYRCWTREATDVFTTCGWMMWNWMASTLATGASLLVFDGNPGFPSLEKLWDVVDRYKVNVLVPVEVSRLLC